VEYIWTLIGEVRYNFAIFSGHECHSDAKLNIFIVDEKDINNPRIFSKKGSAGKVIYGRYFRETNELYITPEFLEKPEFLAHEMAHYFYDECRDEVEENRAYEFQDFYRRKHVRTPR